MRQKLNILYTIGMLTAFFSMGYGQEKSILPGDSDEKEQSKFEVGGFGELHYTDDLPTKIANAITVNGLFEMDYHFNNRMTLHTEVGFEGDHFSNFDEFEAQHFENTVCFWFILPICPRQFRKKRNRPDLLNHNFKKPTKRLYLHFYLKRVVL